LRPATATTTDAATRGAVVAAWRFTSEPWSLPRPTRDGWYSRARYYHPVLQRFISEDPIGFLGGDTNLYAYVRNAPTTVTDPTGMLTITWHAYISTVEAYKCGQALSDSLIFGLNTMLVDFGTQKTTAEDSNIHAMLGTTNANGAPRQQDPADATSRIALIIATGPDYLAAHTVQDKAVAHHYLQPWYAPPWYSRETLKHVWHDMFPSDSERLNAHQGTRAVLVARSSCPLAGRKPPRTP
jgi:RHS repeat-associated protein